MSRPTSDRGLGACSPQDGDNAIDLAWKLPWKPEPRPKYRPQPEAEFLRSNGVTLEVIAQEFGCTRERIRQIEVQALKRCRAWCARNGYTLEDLLGKP